jgi:hypothetical protein
MEPLKPPSTLKIYALIRQTGLTFTGIGFSSTASTLGTGFFATHQEAEFQRTVEMLRDTTTTPRPRYHVFELDVPNPAHEE